MKKLYLLNGGNDTTLKIYERELFKGDLNNLESKTNYILFTDEKNNNDALIFKILNGKRMW